VALLEILGRAAQTYGFRIEQGRKVFNLLPPLPISKGTAVTLLVGEYALDRVVYLGDDATDAHAFRALVDLRQKGNARTLNICVGDDETPASVSGLADAMLPSVEAVADLLWGVLNRLRSSATMDHEPTRAPSVGRHT
jgi:trehalose-phosphatase